MMENKLAGEAAAFTGTIDLAAERVGGKVLLTNDEFFAEKENLIKPGRGIFVADKYTERGKWMDGWETRRKRVPGHDWCIVELGIPGVVSGVDIDTNHFLGNNPAYASIDAISLTDSLQIAQSGENLPWTEILPRVSLKPGSQNIFAVSSTERWTHLRLNIYPDGGVARFRVHGEAAPDWNSLDESKFIDLAAIENGGKVPACSDMFFGNKDNMISPGRAANMGDGWETKRRRGPGHDWAIVKLGHAGMLKLIEVDTNHFKGNYPDRCWIDACYAADTEIDVLNWNQFEWIPVLSETKLQADHRHHFESQIQNAGPWTHVRLNIAPDGGVSRLRLHGTIHLNKNSNKEVTAQTAAAKR